MKAICLTVTNDLTYDQRMHRIAGSLAKHGYAVTLVGRGLPHSVDLDERPFRQHRLRCYWNKGFLFYAEYNLRLFFYLMRASWDAVGVVDLDTLPAGTLAALLKRKARVFDAHEYFTEVPEVTGRPVVKWFWATVARTCLPFFRHAYTVGPALANLFSEKYGIPFQVIRNVPSAIGYRLSAVATRHSPLDIRHSTFATRHSTLRVLLYQGALNEGRGIEAMLEAMTRLEGVQLWLAGEGDLSGKLRRQAAEQGLQDKVRFLGFVRPDDLKDITRQAWMGLNLLENKGLSYYYSLANKYFDYVQAGVPVLTMDFPEYRALQARHAVAVLLPDLRVENIVNAIQNLMDHPDQYDRLAEACRGAREEWVWAREEQTLLAVWADAMG